MAIQIAENGLVDLDANQVIRSTAVVLSDGTLATKVAGITGNIVPEQYDQITLTYVTVGFGIGEIETVVYKYQGNTIATLTLTYDASNNLIDILRS